ncbi:MAG: DNA repair exonuclease [Candidatus Wallbacteria bacterium]|nr:DNA repair exonuclease [Candidatus Wallbacteria bacterium]
MKKAIRFIHTADWHIGYPFTGIGRSDSALQEKLLSASFNSIRNIFELARSEQVDFILIAGDVFEDVQYSQLIPLKYGKLLAEAPPVFIACGNHDPLPWDFKLPPNVHLFSERFSTVELDSVFGKIAITGISHPQKNIESDLTTGFPEKIQGDVFLRIGLIHCNLTEISPEYNYAPTTRKRLLELPVDIWCLGHIHQKTMVYNERNRVILYPGTPQGKKSKYSGLCGCYLVEIDENRKIDARFIATADAEWLEITATLDDLSQLPELIEKSSVIGLASVRLCKLRLTLPAGVQIPPDFLTSDGKNYFYDLEINHPREFLTPLEDQIQTLLSEICDGHSDLPSFQSVRNEIQSLYSECGQTPDWPKLTQEAEKLATELLFHED